MDYSESTNKRRKRRHNPHATRLRNTIGVMIFRVIFAVVLIGGFAAAGAGIGLYLGILRNAPEIHVSDLSRGIYNSVIVDARTGEELIRLSGEENRDFAPISEMPQHLLDAFVAIEDERFHTHNGIDPRGMIRALHVNMTVSGRTEGASTITQQLIKNMLELVRNDLVSKLQEQYLAVQFERELTERHGREGAKEIILEAYLNMINLGRNWHGVQVAAWNYFGKDVSELTLSESAVIAAIPRNPSRYLPDRFPEWNRYRQVLVLEAMLRNEMITEHEFNIAYADPVHDRVLSGLIAQQQFGVIHDYFTDAMIEQVIQDLVEQHTMTREMASAQVFGGGLRIYSTQDSRLQAIVDDVFADNEAFPIDIFEITIEYRLSARNEITGQVSNHQRTGSVRNEDHVQLWLDETRNEFMTASDVIIAENYILMPQPQAAFVLLDHHNGHVLAISGGRGEKTANRSFCRATVATRSPGSQFKVTAAFVPGIDSGALTAATHIIDEPWGIDDGHSPPWSPRNWWSGYRGPTSVRRAIYQSANIASARAYWEIVGPERAFQYLVNMGFTTLEGELSNGRVFRDTGGSVPLGGLTLGVSQLELAASYGMIANAGEYHRPVFYTRVLNQEGLVLLENGHNPQRVISAQAAYILTDMMRDTMTASGATGPRARFRNINMPVAGKTGTSQNVEDLGFTGYTPYFTATIWLGFDTPRTLPRGNENHLDIWRNIMERVHIELELETRNFARPDGVVSASICHQSGLLPTDLCRRAGTVSSDLFVVGTVPSGHCAAHQETWICSLSGLPVTAYCPQQLWIRGIAPIVEYGHECPYHGPHNMDLMPPGGGFWGFPNLPGLPSAPDGGFWNFDQLPPATPWDPTPGLQIPDPPQLPGQGPTWGVDDGSELDLPSLLPTPPPPDQNLETPDWYFPQPPSIDDLPIPVPDPPAPDSPALPPAPPSVDDLPVPEPFATPVDDDVPGWFGV